MFISCYIWSIHFLLFMMSVIYARVSHVAAQSANTRIDCWHRVYVCVAVLIYCIVLQHCLQSFFFFHLTVFRKKLHWMSSIKENCLANKNTQYIYIFFIFDSIFDSVLSLFYICVLDYAFTSWHRVLHTHTYTHSCVYWRINFFKPIQVFWGRECCQQCNIH